MPMRDAAAVRAVLDQPYSGYARRRPLVIRPDVDRLVALVALLGTMLVSGVVLGHPRSAGRA